MLSRDFRLRSPEAWVFVGNGWSGGLVHRRPGFNLLVCFFSLIMFQFIIYLIFIMMDFTTFLSFSYKYLFIEIPRDDGIEFDEMLKMNAWLLVHYFSQNVSTIEPSKFSVHIESSYLQCPLHMFMYERHRKVTKRLKKKTIIALFFIYFLLSSKGKRRFYKSWICNSF